jgi:hypothetical protein
VESVDLGDQEVWEANSVILLTGSGRGQARLQDR